MKRVIIPITILAMSGISLAHPHKDNLPSETEKVERSWPYFGKKKNENKETIEESKTLSASEFAEKLEKRFEKHTHKIERSLKEADAKNDFISKTREIKSADDLRDAANAIEDLVSESAIISNFADMMLDLAEDFDIETSDEGLSLKFDGDRIGRVKVKRDKHTESSLDVEGFGRNMTIEKEVIRRDGKTKTRIVIEVDGDDDFDIDVKPRN